MAPGEVSTRDHGGQEDRTGALTALHPVEEHHGLSEAVDRSAIVALGVVGFAEAHVRQRLLADTPASRSEREGALSSGEGLVIIAHEEEMEGHKLRDPSQPTRVIEGDSEGLGLAQICQDTPQVAGWLERRAHGEPEVDGLLACVSYLWQMRESAQCLLKISHGLTIGRPLHGFVPCLPTVCQGLGPHLA